MKPVKAPSAEDYALMASFEDVRAKLLAAQETVRFDKPLAHWALPKDRRLPYALLDRTLGEVVHGSFRELSATPGIGRRKIASLVMLLGRALQPAPRRTSSCGESAVAAPAGERDEFDLLAVSESAWDEWRATIRRFELDGETLGRLASSLQHLPTVIWDKPLSEYLALSVDEIRRLRTHGDKRVRVVLEVFFAVHRLLGSAGHRGQFALRIQPRFVAALEQWVGDELRRREMPDLQDIRRHLLLPLLNQLELDAGETVHRLVAGRLGIETRVESVREQAERLGVTRARVYQLFEAASRVIAVRWPAGRWQLAALAEKLSTLAPEDERVALVRETRTLLFAEHVAAASAPQPELNAASP